MITIDNIDISRYGASVPLGGYNSLFQWGAAKPLYTNDWAEENGLEVDLSEIFLQNISGSINFSIQGDIDNISSFWSFLQSSPVHSCYFGPIGFGANMTFTKITSLDYAVTFSKIVVNYVINSPDTGAAQPSPIEDIPNQPVSIDGVNLSNFGVWSLYGISNQALLEAGFKGLLSRNISTLNGIQYDENPVLWNAGQRSWTQSSTHSPVKKSALQVSLPCALSSPSISNFWQNYNALKYALIKKNTSVEDSTQACLRTIGLNGTKYGYYSGQTVQDVQIRGDGITVWFNIILTIIR